MTKLRYLIIAGCVSIFLLAGCQRATDFFKTTQEQYLGLSGTIRTFDEN